MYVVYGEKESTFFMELEGGREGEEEDKCRAGRILGGICQQSDTFLHATVAFATAMASATQRERLTDRHRNGSGKIVYLHWGKEVGGGGRPSEASLFIMWVKFFSSGVQLLQSRRRPPTFCTSLHEKARKLKVFSLKVLWKSSF